jgi:hypothetical protein
VAKGREIIPSARRLITSLRDMGYEFAPAVADLVDNSIEAGATRIDVKIEFAGDDSWVRIADNGKGMNSSVLLEAMRYGSERDYAEDDLGKFGLGLKTASMSQCRKLTVASQPKSAGRFTAYSWDLAHVQKTDRWEVLPVSKTVLSDAISESLSAGHRAVILWEQLDRILGYKHPYGENARKQLAQMCREVEEHLSMVFHRFLSGEARSRRIKITLNENPLEAWDPFCRSERCTRKLQARSIPVEHNDVSGEVGFDPYVLPHQNRFSSSEAHEKAAGPRKWNRQQGFYIYRADRLIQSGGWSGLRTQDEHTKLARVALSFSPKLDEAFKINVAKMRVQLPAQLRPELERLLTSVVREADAEYRKGGSNSQPSSTSATNSAANNGAATTSTGDQGGESTGRTAAEEPKFTASELLQQLLSVANSGEKAVLKEVFKRLELAGPRR